VPLLIAIELTAISTDACEIIVILDHDLMVTSRRNQ
jgi:hypothetical protein